MAEEEIKEAEDAQDADAESEQGEQTEVKSKKKLFIIIGAAVLVLLLAGGAAYFFLFSAPDEQAELVASAEPVFFYDMEQITVNLASNGDGVQKFLKISVSLELENEAMMEIITPRMVRIQDAFQVYLRELRPSDLEGSAGIFRLKQELRKRINLAIHPAEVKNILFKEILVQ